jgi:cytochrome c553
MPSKLTRAFCLGSVFLLGPLFSTFAQMPAPAAKPATAADSHPLVWDNTNKTESPKTNEEFATFKFHVTNTSEEPVLIVDAHPSCGCTVPQLPRTPWIMPPHTTDELVVSINLAGKIGQFFKTVTITPSNFPPQILMLTVNMPNSPEADRMRNQMLAAADRQAVFKNDCAQCHLEPAKGKMAKELYVAACGICHDPTAHPRAGMVPNLKALNHPTDYEFWKTYIQHGKPGTLMPAFSTAEGGPLTDEQIESLSKLLTQVYPSQPLRLPPPPVIATNAAIPSIPPLPAPPTNVNIK